MTELYNDLSNYKNLNKKLSKDYNSLCEDNRKLDDKYQLLKDLEEQKDEYILQYKEEILEGNSLINGLKTDNNCLEAKLKNYETQIQIGSDENTNLKNEHSTKTTKINEMNQLLKNQDDMINNFLSDIKKERNESEFNKNKLSVCLVQLKELESKISTIQKEKS